ncbi:MAG: hypothetical protein JXB17_02510 [Bacteroidales bacterium]|nr:hypothetical protein [Bacteroidales bacterium]
MKKQFKIKTLLLLLLVSSCRENIEIPDPPVGKSNKIIITTGNSITSNYTSAQVTSQVNSFQGKNISDHGHCWDTIQNPDIYSHRDALGKLNSNSFISELTNLIPGKQYYVRGYICFNNTNLYSDQISFNTKSASTPEIVTNEISNVTARSALITCLLTNSGGLQVKEKGICWNAFGNPDTNDNRLIDTINTDSLSLFLYDLAINTKYYVRAYAINSKGIGYGEVLDFKTSSLTVQWQEDFEEDSFYIPDDWILEIDIDSNDFDYNYIDDSISYEGWNSLRIFNQPDDYRPTEIYHFLSITPPYELEFAVYNGSEKIEGIYSHRAYIGLSRGKFKTSEKIRFIRFNEEENRNVISMGNNILLDSYNTSQWYLVRIRYEITPDNNVYLAYWINTDSIKESEIVKSNEKESLLNYMELKVGRGSVWFDEIKIYKDVE